MPGNSGSPRLSLPIRLRRISALTGRISWPESLSSPKVAAVALIRISARPFLLSRVATCRIRAVPVWQLSPVRANVRCAAGLSRLSGDQTRHETVEEHERLTDIWLGRICGHDVAAANSRGKPHDRAPGRVAPIVRDRPTSRPQSSHDPPACSVAPSHRCDQPVPASSRSRLAGGPSASQMATNLAQSPIVMCTVPAGPSAAALSS